MRRMIFAAAPLLALTLIAQDMPSAAAAAPPAPASAASSANPAADQFGSWSRLAAAAWTEALEEGCIQDGDAACKMTAAQVKKLPGDITASTKALLAEIDADPAERNALEAARGQIVTDGGPQTRGIASAGAKLTRAIIGYTKNPLVKKLAGKADEIGDIADDVTRGTYAANGLTEGTATAIAKAVIYAMPVVGDVFSLGEAIANGDVEGGVVATISLIGTVVAAACPVAGAVVGVALAVYYVTKMIWGWLCAKERDWIADPPGTEQELFESGADFKWETTKVSGQNVAVAFRTGAGTAQLETDQTLLIDSKWTAYNASRKPVTFAFPKDTAIAFVLPSTVPAYVTATLWQRGKVLSSQQCVNSGAGIGRLIMSVNCALNTSARISTDNPAVLKLAYAYHALKPSSCTKLPCVDQEGKIVLAVLSEGTQRVHVDLPYQLAFV